MLKYRLKEAAKFIGVMLGFLGWGVLSPVLFRLIQILFGKLMWWVLGVSPGTWDFLPALISVVVATFFYGFILIEFFDLD